MAILATMPTTVCRKLPRIEQIRARQKLLDIARRVFDNSAKSTVSIHYSRTNTSLVN